MEVFIGVEYQPPFGPRQRLRSSDDLDRILERLRQADDGFWNSGSGVARFEFYLGLFESLLALRRVNSSGVLLTYVERSGGRGKLLFVGRTKDNRREFVGTLNSAADEVMEDFLVDIERAIEVAKIFAVYGDKPSVVDWVSATAEVKASLTVLPN